MWFDGKFVIYWLERKAIAICSPTLNFSSILRFNEKKCAILLPQNIENNTVCSVEKVEQVVEQNTYCTIWNLFEQRGNRNIWQLSKNIIIRMNATHSPWHRELVQNRTVIVIVIIELEQKVGFGNVHLSIVWMIDNSVKLFSTNKSRKALNKFG